MKQAPPEAKITLDPDPPVQGAKLTICYTNGTLPQTLDLTWDPEAEPTEIECTEENGGCVEITVPDGAVALTVEGGDAPYRDVPVVPPT